MSLDNELAEDFFKSVADKYSGTEIVDILELTEWDIIEMYRELIMEKRESFNV